MSIIGNPLMIGGGGLSKCSIVVHIDEGSAVGAYSDEDATTLVKMGKEIGTSGSYLISGLETGTYYVKATNGTMSKISDAIVFTAAGIKSVTLLYSFVIYENGAVNPALGSLTRVAQSSSGDKTFSTETNITLTEVSYNSTSVTQTCAFENPVDVSPYTTLHIVAKKVTNNYGGTASSTGYVGINTSGTALTYSVSISESNDFAEYTIDVSSLYGDYYVLFYGYCNAGSYGGDGVLTVQQMWLDNSESGE